MKKAKRILARLSMVLFGGIFVWAAFLQLNDADGWLWVGIYLAAAVMAFLAAAGKPLPSVAGKLVFLTFMGMLYLGSTAYTPSAKQMFEEAQQTGWKIVDTEQGREAGGLGLISMMLWGIVKRWPLLKAEQTSDEE